MFATLDTEEYLDFQAARPTVELVDGVIREIQWPALAFSAGSTNPTGRDLVLLLGVEPNLRWPTFCDDVISVARATGCEMVVTLGALLGDVPHSRPMRCTGSATDEVLAARAWAWNGRATKALPESSACSTTRPGARASRRRRSGRRCRTTSRPHRTRRRPSRSSTGSRTCSTSGFELTDLEIAAAAWERSVDEVVAGDADASSYVERLEHRYDEAADAPPDAVEADATAEAGGDTEEDWLDEDDLPSGESLAEDFERYLREQGDE